MCNFFRIMHKLISYPHKKYAKQIFKYKIIKVEGTVYEYEILS